MTLSIISLFNIGLVNIAAMVLVLVITCCSCSLKSHQKVNFSLVYLANIVIIITQFLSLYLEVSRPQYRSLNILVHFVSFLLTPMIPLFFAGAVAGYRRARFLLVTCFFYGVLLLFTVKLRIIYTIDSSSHYVRCGGYWIFVAIYALAVIHLLRETWTLCQTYQNGSRFTVILLALFLAGGISAQFFLPSFYISWTSTSFVSILFYIYCSELWSQADGVTGLLNHSTYLRRMEDLPDGTTLVLFDVDRFKQVNDNYGHLFGDESLRQIARIIRSVYGSLGRCYRIGGDEFAVLIYKKAFNSTEKAMKFRHFIQETRKGRPGMPDVSLGYAQYRKGMSTQELMNQADRNMYSQKLGKQ